MINEQEKYSVDFQKFPLFFQKSLHVIRNFTIYVSRTRTYDDEVSSFLPSDVC